MREVDPIEAALARLMPVAMSDSGERSIHETLDELAADLPVNRWQTRRPWGIGLGIAAAAVAGVFVAWPSLHAPAPASVAMEESSASPVEWVGNADRVESLRDEGRISGADGDALQAVSVRVVAENTLRDRETGYTFNISEPREELVLM
ncbi:MAG TPA: hypothetical protein VIM57_01745, partial [Luteolibacter sp.]